MRGYGRLLGLASTTVKVPDVQWRCGPDQCKLRRCVGQVVAEASGEGRRRAARAIAEMEARADADEAALCVSLALVWAGAVGL